MIDLIRRLLGIRKERVVTVYMCGVDWQHELGEASGGNRVFASQTDCERNYPCVAQCGVVEIEVRLKRWVKPQDFSRLDEEPDNVESAE